MTPPVSPSTGKQWVCIEAVLERYEDGSFVPTTFDEVVERSIEDYRPDWHLLAACKGIERGDEIFFGNIDTAVRPTLSISQVLKAKRICDTCPVYEDCLTHSLTQREEFGIWAGTSGRTRERIFKMLDDGLATIEQVVKDYLSGHYDLYERLRRDIDDRAC